MHDADANDDNATSDAYHHQCWGEPSPRAFARKCRVAGPLRVQVVDPGAVPSGVRR